MGRRAGKPESHVKLSKDYTTPLFTYGSRVKCAVRGWVRLSLCVRDPLPQPAGQHVWQEREVVVGADNS